jgi:hypothetical protein
LYGTKHPLPHEKPFNVIPWNSLYIVIPRFVFYHPMPHREFTTHREIGGIGNPEYGRRRHTCSPVKVFKVKNKYKHYTKRILYESEKSSLHPVDPSMMWGAFRPHPNLQQHIHQLVEARDNQTSDG